MSRRTRLALRFFDAFSAASGMDDEAMERHCEALEAGLQVFRETRPGAKTVTANTPVDWESLFGEDSGTASTLRASGLTTFGIVQMITEKQLLEIRLIGSRKRDQIKDFLGERGLRLRSPKEHFTTRAREIYESVDAVPISVITIDVLYDSEINMLNELGLHTIGDALSISVASLRAQGRSEGEIRLLERLHHWLNELGLTLID